MASERLIQYFIDKIPSTEINSVLEYLRDKLGMDILPKRELSIPSIGNDQLERLYRPEHVTTIASQLDIMHHFLHGIPVSDNITGTHKERRILRIQMYDEIEKEFGERVANFFWDLYYNRNQLRINNIYPALTALQTLEDYPLVPQLEGTVIVPKDTTIDIAYLLTGDKYNDPPLPAYDDLTDPMEKLYIVHFIEDQCVEALQTLVRI